MKEQTRDDLEMDPEMWVLGTTLFAAKLGAHMRVAAKPDMLHGCAGRSTSSCSWQSGWGSGGRVRVRVRTPREMMLEQRRTTCTTYQTT